MRRLSLRARLLLGVVLLAEPSADLDAFDVGEHPVEHEEIRLRLGDCFERVAPGVRLVDVIPLVAQRRRDRVDDRVFVVDDEDALLQGAVVPVEAHAEHPHIRFCEPSEKRRLSRRS